MKQPHIITLSILFMGAIVIDSCYASQKPVQIDAAFNARFEKPGVVNLIAAQADGKSIIAGRFTGINGFGIANLARINAEGSPDASFKLKCLDIFQNNIMALWVQPDGKILVGGGINYLISSTANSWDSRMYLARLYADGSVDTNFNIGSWSDGKTDGDIYAITMDPNNRILVGGDFTKINGVDRNRLARLNLDGTVDTSFDPGKGPNGRVNAITLQKDGQILIGGEFDSYNEVSLPHYARLNPNGSVDTHFTVGSGTDGTVNSIVVLPNNQIVIGGGFQNVHNTDMPHVAKLESNGTLNNSLKNYYFYSVNSLIALPDNSVLVGGWNPEIIFNGQPTDHKATIIRFSASGAPEGVTYFEGYSDIYSMARRSDGKVLIAGSFNSLEIRPSQPNQTYRYGLCLVNNYAQVETSFVPVIGYPGTIISAHKQPDGKIVVAGDFTLVNGLNKTNYTRIDSNGLLDSSYNPNTATIETPRASVMLPDGKWLVAGKGVVSLKLDGTIETNFGGNVTNTLVQKLLLLPDQKVLVAGLKQGNFNGLERYFLSGKPDTNFNTGDGLPDYTQSILDMAKQPDGKILVVGRFDAFNKKSFTNIVRLLDSGMIDTNFVPPALTSFSQWPAECHSVVVDSTGKIYVGGYFSKANGTDVSPIIRLNSDGSLDPSFSPGLPNSGGKVTLIAPQDDGSMFITGNFWYDISGVYGNSMARINTSGILDKNFPMSAEQAYADAYTIVSIIPLTGQQMFIAGSFTEVLDTPASSCARLVIQKVDTVEPPKLEIQLGSGKNAILSWPSSSSPFNLEYKETLRPAADWQKVQELPIMSGAKYFVTNSATAGNRFYRLKN